MERNSPYPWEGDFTPPLLAALLKHLIFLLLLIALSVSLSGCVTMTDPEASQDFTSDAITVLDAQTSLGQTFVSRRPDLNGITIWVTRVAPTSAGTPPANADVLTVQLFHSRSDPQPLITRYLVIPPVAANLPITVPLPGQHDPGGQNYYLVLANDSGTIQINGRAEDAYSLGQAFANDQPVNSDIAFRLTYDYGITSFLNDIRSAPHSVWLVFPLLFVLWLPGWLILDFSGLRERFDFGEQSALAIGFSLAVTPVLMLWSTLLKLRWTSRALYFAAGLLVSVFLVRVIYSAISAKNNRSRETLGQVDHSAGSPGGTKRGINWVPLALVLVFLVTLVTRLIMIRDLATPAWVDSVHHALITRLIMDAGHYPSTYLPYWSFPTTDYHPGFHSLAASFTWLSQLDLVHSLLVFGQVLNALSVFAVYLLAKTLTRSAQAGLFAAIITGFLTPMPAYYTSWGRYTELAGLLLLPVILALFQSWIDTRTKQHRVNILLLTSLAIAGLFMVHYRVLVFTVCLLVPFALFRLLIAEQEMKAKLPHLLIFLSLVALASIILVLPWFIPAFKITLLPFLSPSTSSVALFSGFTWSYLTSALGTQTLVVAGLGLLWGVLKGRRLPFIIILWVFLLFLVANLAAFSLPGAGLVNNSSVEIMLFVPISVLGGYFIASLLENWKAFIPPRWLLPSAALLFLLTGAVSFYGARQLVAIINPVTILTRTADLPAIQWISENIPQGETLVINPFAWGYNNYAGTDGGFWISPLSGRLTLPPPVLYGLDSDAPEIDRLSQEIINSSPDPNAFWELLHLHNLHYVYVGARGGVIPPEKLTASGLFTPIYHQSGVWIFHVKP